MGAHILVVDDELSMREFLGIILRKAGYRVSAAAEGRAALEIAAKDAPDVVISDLKMPGMDGTALLRELKTRAPELPIVVITAFATWESTVEAMRLGAYDYIKKPFDTDEIREVVERAITHRSITGKANERPEMPELRDMVGGSPKMREAVDVARRVAGTEATVLLHGESGTGKELFARMLHYYSARANEPFISVNCGAFPESLLESELFGHVRGSFTGAVADKKGLFTLADGGTFFLDEVGELPLGMQVKLLRVLEERQFYAVGGVKPVRVDVRIVCATNRDLAEEVRRGAFRGDLFFRLNVVPIRLPPLRERQGDIPLLAGYFVRKYARALGREITGIAASAQAMLERYPWPGNVRELENAIQRAIALARGSTIEEIQVAEGLYPSPARPALATPASVPAMPTIPAVGGAEAPGAADPSLAPPLPPVPETGFDLEATLAAIERCYIEDALARTEGNLTRAADLLGISFRSIRYKVKKLGIRV